MSKTKMTPEEVRVQWLAALLSGDFRQAKSYLRRSENSFCCLGVLCELYRETEGEGKSSWRQESGDPFAPKRSYFKTPHDLNDGFPPKEVLEWAGLSLNDMRTLASMNDTGASFRRIAKAIDEDIGITMPSVLG